jgi:hypothetical protein
MPRLVIWIGSVTVQPSKCDIVIIRMRNVLIMTFKHSKGNIAIIGGSFVLAAIVFCALGPEQAVAQAAIPVEISSPKEGDVVQGIVEIMGSIMAGGFVSAQLAFAYSTEPIDTWFLIADIPQPVAEAKLAEWDTTAIADGDYVLRLRMINSSGVGTDALVGVQVRNYTALPVLAQTQSATDVPFIQVGTPAVIRDTPTVVRESTATPIVLPANRATLTAGQVLLGFSRGGIVALAVCVVVGALLVRHHH